MNSPKPRRTLVSILLGIAAILLGGLGSLFSLFALLFAIGKPYANANADPLGIFLIFLLPPGTLLAGIGLLCRHRWAWWWMVLLMVGLIGLGVKGLVAPDHANPAYAPRPGPAADAMKRAVLLQSIGCVAVGGLVLLALWSGPVRREFRKAAPRPAAPAGPPALPATPASTSEPEPAQTPADPPPQDDRLAWRVGHRGRDQMYYEESHGGNWRRIEIDGEMLTGRAHHVIYFANPDTWQRYPEWARHRRDEIIARIKSRFREPDYEYGENGSAFSATTETTSRPAPATLPANSSDPAASPPLPRRDGTILPALAGLLLVAALCFGMAARGVARGETRLPVRHGAGGGTVSRAEKPVLFWTSIGLIGATGAGCAGLAAWLVLERWRRPGTGDSPGA